MKMPLWPNKRSVRLPKHDMVKTLVQAESQLTRPIIYVPYRAVNPEVSPVGSSGPNICSSMLVEKAMITLIAVNSWKITHATLTQDALTYLGSVTNASFRVVSVDLPPF